MYKIDKYKQDKENILKNVMFTNRERDIFNCLIEGLNCTNISKKLKWSKRTIQYDTKNIQKQIDNYYNKKETQLFSVYIHIFPNGKKYVGFTENIIRRWGKGGIPYSSNIKMYEDIINYGWENIQHIILLETNDEYKARQLESKLIEIFDLTNDNNGYNKKT